LIYILFFTGDFCSGNYDKNDIISWLFRSVNDHREIDGTENRMEGVLLLLDEETGWKMISPSWGS
jgi:hypothetical protein